MTKKQKLSSKKIYDVAICGAGPVGLSMAYLLGQAGLKVGIFEKRANTTNLPKVSMCMPLLVNFSPMGRLGPTKIFWLGPRKIKRSGFLYKYCQRSRR